MINLKINEKATAVMKLLYYWGEREERQIRNWGSRHKAIMREGKTGGIRIGHIECLLMRVLCCERN